MRFNSSRLKIEWADRHILDLEQRLAALPDKYTSSVEVDSATGNKSIKHDVADGRYLIDAALLIGDAVHNLNCALDYAWVEVCKVFPDLRSASRRFPIFETKKELEGQLRKGKVEVVSPELFDLLLNKIGSYNGGNFAIWTVHDINNADKHRLLIPIIPYAAIVDIELENESGELYTGSSMGTEEHPPYYITFPPNVKVRDKGNLFFEVSFDETVIEYGPRVKDTLRIYSRFILQVIETLEAFIETI